MIKKNINDLYSLGVKTSVPICELREFQAKLEQKEFWYGNTKNMRMYIMVNIEGTFYFVEKNIEYTMSNTIDNMDITSLCFNKITKIKKSKLDHINKLPFGYIPYLL